MMDPQDFDIPDQQALDQPVPPVGNEATGHDGIVVEGATFRFQNEEGFVSSPEEEIVTEDTRLPGFTLYNFNDGGTEGFKVIPATVTGFTNIVVPEWSGTSLTDEPFITVGTGTETLYLRMAIDVESSPIIGATDAFYISGGELNGAVTVVGVDDSQRGIIDPGTGSVTQNIICCVPICEVTNPGGSNPYTFTQLNYGPIACVVCETGQVLVHGAIYL